MQSASDRRSFSLRKKSFFCQETCIRKSNHKKTHRKHKSILLSRIKLHIYLLRRRRQSPIKNVNAGSSTAIIISHNRRVCCRGSVREYNVRNHWGEYNSGGKSWSLRCNASSGSKYSSSTWNSRKALNKKEESSRQRWRSRYRKRNASNSACGRAFPFGGGCMDINGASTCDIWQNDWVSHLTLR